MARTRIGSSCSSDTEVSDDGAVIYKSFLATIPPDVLEYFVYAFSGSALICSNYLLVNT